MVNVTFRTTLNNNNSVYFPHLRCLLERNMSAIFLLMNLIPIPPWVFLFHLTSVVLLLSASLSIFLFFLVSPTLQVDLSRLFHRLCCKGLSVLPDPSVLPTKGPVHFPHVCTGCSSGSQVWPSNKHPSMYFKPVVKRPMRLQRGVTRKITQEAPHTALTRSKCLTSVSHFTIFIIRLNINVLCFSITFRLWFLIEFIKWTIINFPPSLFYPSSNWTTIPLCFSQKYI